MINMSKARRKLMEEARIRSEKEKKKKKQITKGEWKGYF